MDNGDAFGALMTDLCKAFDCLHHELLIAKLDAYAFDIKSVKLIQKYLSNKGLKQVMYTDHGKKFSMEFHRDQSLVPLFSISFCVTYFISSKASL